MPRLQLFGDVGVCIRDSRACWMLGCAEHWVVMDVTSLWHMYMWLFGCVGSLVDFSGWLVIGPLGAARSLR